MLASPFFLQGCFNCFLHICDKASSSTQWLRAVDTTSVVRVKQLKETMHREVLDAMDHRFLNKEVPEFATRIPTTENLAIAIWQRLAPKLTNATLHRVRVYENHDLFVDFYGEG